MANPFLQGVASANQTIQVNNQTNAETRRQKQQELSNFIKGFEQDQNGGYTPNARGQQALDAQSQQQQQALMVLQAQNEAIAATQNAKSMTDATTALVMGDAKEANRIVENNPILKQKLLEQFGAAAVQPVDFVNDRDALKEAGINVTDDMLKDSKVVNALNSALFKIIGPDGKSKIASTNLLIDSSGYMQYADKPTRDGVYARVNKISEILSGHIKTPAEKALEAKKLDTANTAATMQNDIVSLTKEYQDTILDDDTLSAEEKLAKLNGARGKSKEELELQIKEEKLKKAKADTITAQAKAEDSKPFEGEAEFISNIRDSKKIPFNDNTLRTASKLQGKKTLTAERGKEVNGRFSMAKSFDNFTRKFKEANINRDALAKIGTTMDKLMKPGMTGQDQEKVLNTIEIDTELRALISEYVKFMSGAAVTTEEFNRYNDIVQSGVWSSRESAEEALRSFTNYLRRSAKDRIDSITDLPHDYLIKRNDYETWANNNPEIQRAKKQETKDTSVFNKYRRR